MKISKVARQVLQTAAAVVVVGLVVYFFRDQFSRNWDQLGRQALRLAPVPLAASLVALVVSYLSVTAMWRRGANQLSTGGSFSFLESVGMVNTTQLTKYIPGKIWGYAMQIALVDRRSLPVSAVLYVNVVIALTNSFLALIVGGLYLTFFSHLVPFAFAGLATFAAALLYLFFLLFNGRFFGLFVAMLSRLLGRRIEFFQLARGPLLRLQALSIVSAAACGFSAVLGGWGIGFDPGPALIWPVSAGFVLADTVGFLAFFVPGGIGVREGLFYALLSELHAGPLALILPIAMRVISMLVDALLGLVGVVTLRRYVKEGTS